MFLSKKNAQFLNKPGKNKKITPRVLPGWADDEDTTEQQSEFRPEYNNKSYNKKQSGNLLEGADLGQGQETDQGQHRQGKENRNKIYYNWDQLNQMQNIQCERRLVESIVEPVGVKVKPTDNQLVQFAKQAKSMEPSIIGSLLLSKLEENYPFLVKAKSLYTIEYLVKKNPSFCTYFKHQSQLLQQFPEPEDNVDNYRKILKTVLNVIGVSTGEKEEEDAQNQAISFVDPGYNDFKQLPKTRPVVGPAQLQPNRKFVSPSDAKKTMQGLTSKKTDNTFDIFSEQPEQKTSKVSNGFDDLLLVGEPTQPTTNQISFDDLMKGSAQPTQQGPQSNYLNFTL